MRRRRVLAAAAGAAIAPGARALGLELPQTLVLRADRVIE